MLNRTMHSKGLVWVVLALALAATGCCSEPWKVYPEKTAPDRSCTTGSTHGHDVYIWECLGGEHVVVAQYSAEMSCQRPRRDTAPCGSLTKLEQELELKPEMCTGPRPGRAWR